jgi:hypothetical protein
MLKALEKRSMAWAHLQMLVSFELEVGAVSAYPPRRREPLGAERPAHGAQPISPGRTIPGKETEMA